MYAYFKTVENFPEMGNIIKPFLKPSSCQVIFELRDAFLKKEKKKKEKQKVNQQVSAKTM